MRHLALSDLSDEDLRTMLAENETLFVEHKGGLGGEGYQIAKALCSFANGLGGWVLIGVTNGRPNAGNEGGWHPVAAHEITDRAREALRANRVDPIPAFAATVVTFDGKPVGVVRVYESTDTPHVMGNGQVFVRSVAEDSDARRKYRPGGVETQAVLVSLAERGRQGLADARDKFNPDKAPLAAAAVGVSGSTFATSSRGLIGVRATPLNARSLFDWSVSERAIPVLETEARKLARREDEIPLGAPRPYASGLSVEARSENLLASASGERDGVASLTADAAGVVAACLRFSIWEPPRGDRTVLSLDQVRDEMLAPLLGSVASILHRAEAYGRVLLELAVGQLTEVIALAEDDGPKEMPAGLPVGGELTLPLDPSGAELSTVAEQWRSVLGRAAGYLTLRP